MISNSNNIEIIHELIEQLGQRGLHGLSDLLRTEGRKGCANCFKDKKVQSRFGPL